LVKNKFEQIKPIIKNSSIFIIYLIGTLILTFGIYNLYTDECKALKIVLKENNLLNKEVNIKTYLNKNYQCKIEKIDCKKQIAFVKACNKEIKLDNILEINKVNVYKIVSDKISKRAIKGIILVAIGGFILIIVTVLKDYI